MQEVFHNVLKEEKKKGTTIFYSTHILSDISKVCDRVGIIKNGELIKVETMKDLSKKNLTFVKISSKDIEEIKKDLKIEVIEQDNNQIKFANKLSPNELIKKLSKYDIEKILIEEATLEEMFLHYYK